jgi:Holliday junction resolvasome RuvABC DNA-binding subunit
MTPEQLEEIPGIGEKTLEKISVAVRHYFGQFEEGEEGFTCRGREAERSLQDEERAKRSWRNAPAEAENDASSPKRRTSAPRKKMRKAGSAAVRYSSCR